MLDFNRAQAGDTLAISANEWNRVRQAANIVEELSRRMGGRTLEGWLDEGVFLCVPTDRSWKVGEVGYVRGFATSPERWGAVSEEYALEVLTPSYSMDAPLAVAVEDVKQGTPGRFRCAGCALARWVGTDTMNERAVPDGNGALIEGDGAGAVSVIAADAVKHCALIAIGGAGGGAAYSLGMFDTRLETVDDKLGRRRRLVCWNSAHPEDPAAGIVAVNCQHFEVQAAASDIPNGAEVRCYVHFTPSHFAEDASPLNGQDATGDIAPRAVLELWQELKQSTPDDVYALVAVVHANGQLEKVRPRGVIEMPWYGPAFDLWKDTIETGSKG